MTAIARSGRSIAFGPLVPLAVLGVLAFTTAGILRLAGETIGYDYQAYLQAAERLLAGQALYDPTVDVAGGFAIYLYPPPFAVLLLPFTALPAGDLGAWLWGAVLAVTFVIGALLLPVRREVRWLVVLLGAISWPLLYSIKLGQVGPILFLAFAAGWRWRDRPGPLGLAIAAGTLVKLQPALLFGWALVTGRWRAIAIGVLALAAAAAAVTVVVGPATWLDYVALLRRVSTPVTTPHNFAPGAVAFQLGATEALASAIQWASLGTAALVTLWAWLRADAVTGYVVTVVASQLLSPLLWDHYAVLLLLPTALLLERGHRWAVLIPLAGWLPGPFVPVMFGVGLLAPLLPSRAATRVSPPPRSVARTHHLG